MWAVCLIIQKSNHCRLHSSSAHTELVLQSPLTTSIIGSMSGSFSTMKFFHIILFLEKERKKKKKKSRHNRNSFFAQCNIVFQGMPTTTLGASCFSLWEQGLFPIGNSHLPSPKPHYNLFFPYLSNYCLAPNSEIRIN